MLVEQNRLFLVSGVSGSGKTTIMRELMDNEIVSFTTRQPRDGEVDGFDYIFIDRDEFDLLLSTNGLIEHTQYSGNYYGVTRLEYETKLNCEDTFFICDIEGMKQMKKIHSNCTSIFIYCERETVENNMRKRGDSEENIFKRLKTYDEEIDNMFYYDHIIVNRENEIEETILNVKDIICGG